jgi:hypothetical protein
VLLVATVGAWTAVIAGVLVTAVALAASGLLVAYLAALRAAARARAERRRLQAAPVADPVVDHGVPAARAWDASRQAVADADTIVLEPVKDVVDLTAVEPDDGTWVPVPVPPPTYTLKPMAPRPQPAPLQVRPVPETAESDLADAAPERPWERAAGRGGDLAQPLDLDEVLARRRAVND